MRCRDGGLWIWDIGGGEGRGWRSCVRGARPGEWGGLLLKLWGGEREGGGRWDVCWIVELLVSKYLCHDAKRGVEGEIYLLDVSTRWLDLCHKVLNTNTCLAFHDLVTSHHLAVSQESREFHDVYSWVKTTDVSKEAKDYNPPVPATMTPQEEFHMIPARNSEQIQGKAEMVFSYQVDSKWVSVQ